jgi:hypothetical protein
MYVSRLLGRKQDFLRKLFSRAARHHPKQMRRALQLAEKVLQRRNYREGLLQGLKPDADWIGFIGPTKVVPLLQSL